MKNIILSSVVVLAIVVAGCCTTKPDNITAPTVTHDKYGYYLTRCTCYPKDSNAYLIYPETIQELDSCKKIGLECFQYSYPVSWLQY